MAILAWAYTPDLWDKNFTILVESFIDILIMHLVFSQIGAEKRIF